MLKRLVDRRLLGPSQQVLGVQPEELPYRELPPCTIASLYMMYQSFHRASLSTGPPASKSLFYPIAKQWTTTCLGIRRQVEHAMCVECQSLRAAIARTTNFEDHARLCDRLLQHYHETWQDRMCYWLARDHAQVADSNLLVVIVDSFDKSKLHLPAFPLKRVPKRGIYEKYLRVLALIVYGLSTSYLVAALAWQHFLELRSQCNFDGGTHPRTWLLALLGQP